ncbi:hypothetical protein HAX54_010955, partial [Datura stramonium]|nr:hypothetical protein [Datura stramonium]
PNAYNPAQCESHELYMRDTITCKRRVKQQAKQYVMDYAKKAKLRQQKELGLGRSDIVEK